MPLQSGLRLSVAQAMSLLSQLKAMDYSDSDPAVCVLNKLLEKQGDALAENPSLMLDQSTPNNPIKLLTRPQLERVRAQVVAVRLISLADPPCVRLENPYFAADGTTPSASSLPPPQLPSHHSSAVSTAISAAPSTQPQAPPSTVATTIATTAAAAATVVDPPSTMTPTPMEYTCDLSLGPLAGTLSEGRLLTSLAAPAVMDPVELLREEERRDAAAVQQRIAQLEALPADLPVELRTRALIELKALRLRGLQQKVRLNVVRSLKHETTLDTTCNRNLYRRLAKPTLREAKITERLEAQQRAESARRKRAKQMEYLESVMQHAGAFREFHRNVRQRQAALARAAQAFNVSMEREAKRMEEQREKERMRRLMEEDEEGYRKLLDGEKDKRLTTLLDQTDTYIKQMGELVLRHKRLQDEEGAGGAAAAAKKKRGRGRPAEGAVAAEQEELLIEERAQDPAMEGQIMEVVAAAEDEYQEEDGKTTYFNLAHHIKEAIDEQPSTLRHGQLKSYQLQGLEWLISLYNNKLNGILADEMGLGKTIQTMGLLCYLMEKKLDNGPFLIIVPLSVMSNWTLEFDRWAPHIKRLEYKGSAYFRKQHADRLRSQTYNAVLTTYEYIIRDKAVLSKINWHYIIIDEGHRMKNHNCKLSQTLTQHYSSANRLLLSGTPLQNNLQEMWALLNFLLPSIFNSPETFDEWFNKPFANTGEKLELTEEETILVLRRLHKVLRPFLLRRLKKDVESQLPDKVEYVLKCEMSGLQRRVYLKMKDKGILLTENGSKKPGKTSQNQLMNTIMQLRKICNHPFMFQEVELAMARHLGYTTNTVHGRDLVRAAGKFELLDRLLPKLIRFNHRVLMFCQMTNLMTVMEDFLAWKGIKYLRLDGSTKPEERGELLEKFNAPDSPYFLFLLSTRAGGLGLNLQTADTVIIFDSDWNPHQDQQAQDRAHRIGQKNEVRVFRLVIANSVEEKILAAAQYKLDMDEKVIQAGKFDQKSTGAERRQLLEALVSGGERDEDEEEELVDDEMLNTMVARTDEEFAVFQQMDLDVRAQDEHRLFQEKELPEEMLVDEPEVDSEELAAQAAADFGRGRRERKDVAYDDGMSEAQFLRAAEAGEIDESLSRKRSRSRAMGSPTSSGYASPAVGSRAQSPSGGDPHLRSLLLLLYSQMTEQKDANGDQLVMDFVRLPSRRDLPYYYTVIQQPMDFVRIKSKISQNRYGSVDEMAADVILLCDNAEQFNQEDSEIYQTSKQIRQLWRDVTQSVLGETLHDETATTTTTTEDAATPRVLIRMQAPKRSADEASHDAGCDTSTAPEWETEPKRPRLD